MVWIGAGADDEVVLQVAAVAVVNEVNAGIDVGVADAAIGGDVGDPGFGVGAEEVVDAAVEGVDGLRGDAARAAGEFGSEAAAGSGKFYGGFAGRELDEEAVGGVGYEIVAGGGLAEIPFKGEWDGG